MFKKLKEKTAELKDRAKKKVSDATEQSRRFRESMESITGVDKARERFARKHESYWQQRFCCWTRRIFRSCHDPIIAKRRVFEDRRESL